RIREDLDGHPVAGRASEEPARGNYPDECAEPARDIRALVPLGGRHGGVGTTAVATQPRAPRGAAHDRGRTAAGFFGGERPEERTGDSPAGRVEPSARGLL